MANQVEIKD